MQNFDFVAVGADTIADGLTRLQQEIAKYYSDKDFAIQNLFIVPELRTPPATSVNQQPVMGVSIVAVMVECTPLELHKMSAVLFEEALKRQIDRLICHEPSAPVKRKPAAKKPSGQ